MFGCFSTGIQHGMSKAEWETLIGSLRVVTLLADRIRPAVANSTPLAGVANILTINYTINPAAVNGSVITFTGVGELLLGFTGADVTVNNVPTAVPSLTLNLIPEPMTIALLGLGGLFIRRKK